MFQFFLLLLHLSKAIPCTVNRIVDFRFIHLKTIKHGENGAVQTFNTACLNAYSSDRLEVTVHPSIVVSILSG